MNIWLDDVRDPRFFSRGIWDEGPKLDWIWVRNKAELEKLLGSTEGRIEIMSFDHDLGAHNEPTGYDIIKWLAEEQLDRYPKDTRFHTANPVGEKNMRAFDKNVRKHLLSE